jgi:hypothetical protein
VIKIDTVRKNSIPLPNNKRTPSKELKIPTKLTPLKKSNQNFELPKFEEINIESDH